jgi:hypothetical protein
MSIERSIFNSKTEVASFAESKYGIIPTEVDRLYGGSANCYRLTVGDTYYFLKEFPRDFDKAALLREMRVCALLAEKGVPYELHIYPSGVHGLSTGDYEVSPHTEDKKYAVWMQDCAEFFRRFCTEKF